MNDKLENDTLETDMKLFVSEKTYYSVGVFGTTEGLAIRCRGVLLTGDSSPTNVELSTDTGCREHTNQTTAIPAITNSWN